VHRVVILGRGGAGKSTAATRLGVVLGLPVLELDRYFWAPDLIPMPRQEWIEVQQRLAAADHATSADVHIFRAPRQLARFIAQLESYEPPPEARPASC